MESRRTFLGLAAASLVPMITNAEAAQAPAAAGPGGELARHALNGPFEGYEAVLVEVASPATPTATQGTAHRHPGPVLGYVLDGRLRFGINGEPEKIIAAGSTFFEPIGALHSTSGSAQGAPARFLAFMVVPKGSPVVISA